MNDILILVVEDEKDLNALICAELQDEGFKTLSAHTGALGLEISREQRPDLLLLDVNLPDTSGIDVANQLAGEDETRDIPVIIITSQIDYTTRVASFVSGARRFISKPFEMDQLIEEVRKLLKKMHRLEAD